MKMCCSFGNPILQQPSVGTTSSVTLPYERNLSKMAAHKIPCIFKKTKIFYSSCLFKITLCEIVLQYSLSFPSNQCIDSEVHAYSTVKTSIILTLTHKLAYFQRWLPTKFPWFSIKVTYFHHQILSYLILLYILTPKLSQNSMHAFRTACTLYSVIR